MVCGIGDTDQEAIQKHDKNLKQLLERCRQYDLRLHKERTELRKPHIKLLGHVVSKEGLKVDDDKIDTIVKMQTPPNVTDVQRLTGMVNYLAKFMTHLSTFIEPIRKLAIKDTEWYWGPKQECMLQKIKYLITKTPVLAYFDANKELTIQCDASQS